MNAQQIMHHSRLSIFFSSYFHRATAPNVIWNFDEQNVRKVDSILVKILLISRVIKHNRQCIRSVCQYLLLYGDEEENTDKCKV